MLKKIALITGILFFIICPVSVKAEENIIESYSGVQYNTYSFKYHNELASEREHGQKITGDFGWFGGFRTWITRKLACGLELERIQASSEAIYLDKISSDSGETKYRTGIDFAALTEGGLITLTYDLSSVETFDSRVLVIAGVGQYRTRLDCYIKEDSSQYLAEEEASYLGSKIGVETKQEITDNTVFGGRIIYRSADIKSDLETRYGHNSIDFSGLEFSTYLSLGF